MKIAMFPGTFDPITLGHISVIERSVTSVADKVMVAVFVGSKKKPLFAVEQRVAMAREALAHLGARVEVKSFDGLLVDFARDNGISVNVRGVRCVADFEYELRMSYINKKMYAALETIFMPSADIYRYISSSLVREIASLGGDLTPFVSANVRETLEGMRTKP
jgi:pantetheine-phosphate adenylyltransferase